VPAKQKEKERVGDVQPIEAASGDFNGIPFVLSPNEIFAGDHELVRNYPHLFRPVEARRSRPEVEQATAAPGERRG
jgi:hypothetical protein